MAETFNFEKIITFRQSMYFVYILQSQKNKSLYVGYTTNLKKRVREHSDGRNISTRPFRPYKLIFYEVFLNRIDAKSREEYLKSGWGWRSIKKLLKNYLGENKVVQ